MNALLAALFVTSSLIVLAVSAYGSEYKWRGSKLGLICYGLGTFVWSLQGLEANSNGLIFISVLQTCMVLIGVLSFEKE